MTPEEQGPTPEATVLARNIPLAVPTPGSVEEMPIRRSDWRRIRNDVNRLQRHKGTIGRDFAFWFFGAAIATVIATVTLPGQVVRSHPLMQPMFTAATVALALAGIICVVFHLILRGKQKDDVQRICDDMEQMEKDYESNLGVGDIRA